MKARLLKFELHRQQRFTESNVFGMIEKTLLFDRPIEGAIMPADLTEFSEAATNIAQIEKEGLRITDFKKIYSPAPIDIKLFDIIIENNNEVLYKVIKVYDYRKYGKLGKHTKAILAEMT